MKVLFLSLFLLSSHALASEAKKDNYSIYHYIKCYELFVRERPPKDDFFYQLLLKRKITSLQACMNLLKTAQFTNKLTISDPENNVLGQKVLRTFNQFHNTWFPNHLTYMTTDGPETFDLVELEEPALFVTQALFNPYWNYKDILLGFNSYEGIRISKTKSQYLIGSLSSPKIKISDDNFQSGLKEYAKWSPHQLDRGILVGVRETIKNKDILPKSINDLFFPKLSTEPIDIHASAGGGFMGSNSYLLFNIGRSLGEKSNGANALPRKLFQQVLKDVLCRELPVLEPEDTLKYLDTNSPVPWGNNKNCMACHVTMDNMAAALRNTEIVLSRDDGQGSYHVKLYKPKIKNKNNVLYWKSDNYHITEGAGKFVYRDIHDHLIEEPISNLNDAGQKMTKLDEFYQCATIRYLHFLTGIKATITVQKGISSGAKLDKNIVLWSQILKKTQRLDVLIKDILDSHYFRERSPVID